MEADSQSVIRIVPRPGLSVEDQEKVEAALDLIAEKSTVEYDGSKLDKSVDISTPSKKRRRIEVQNYSSKCSKCKSHRTSVVSEVYSSESEDSDISEHKHHSLHSKKEHKPSVEQWCRSKILLTRTMMESLVDPATRAYRLTTKDNVCPRQLRMFAKTARQSYECRDFFKNQVIKVLTPHQQILELPLNGRHSLRYTGAMEDRGRGLVKAILSLNFEWDITVTFMKDCGFGSKSARKIIDEFYPPDKEDQAIVQLEKARKLIEMVEAANLPNNRVLQTAVLNVAQ
jgi:hypothetical protein